ncbi:MAG: hypothetical protein ACE5E7_18190 [Anaerolineae bacterium]
MRNDEPGPLTASVIGRRFFDTKSHPIPEKAQQRWEQEYTGDRVDKQTGEAVGWYLGRVGPEGVANGCTHFGAAASLMVAGR